MNRKEVVSFRKKIEPGVREIIRERVKASGTVEKIIIRFYLGEQLSLRIRPCVEKKGQQLVDLITYPRGTDNYITGDDDPPMPFDVVFPVYNDDNIAVIVQNTGEIASRLSVDIEVDYYAGDKRVIGGVV
ncbi:MAG: hypothetical protein N4A68_07540 [Maledivibacter sp.]|jgi:hypothetical protein|nr:hypothetical protein [Maledivibacter sp.]